MFFIKSVLRQLFENVRNPSKMFLQNWTKNKETGEVRGFHIAPLFTEDMQLSCERKVILALAADSREAKSTYITLCLKRCHASMFTLDSEDLQHTHGEYE